MAPKPPTVARRRYTLPVYTVHLLREAALAFDPDGERVTSPRAAAALLRRFIGPRDREHCVMLLLDTKNAPLGVHTVSVGSLNETVLHPREVFKVALLAGAAGIIVAHNHPSGDPTPSPADRAVARRLRQAGELLGVALLDFLVLGHLAHTSFADRGELT